MKVIIQARCGSCHALLLESITDAQKATPLVTIKCDQHPNHKFYLVPIPQDA